MAIAPGWEGVEGHHVCKGDMGLWHAVRTQGLPQQLVTTLLPWPAPS